MITQNTLIQKADAAAHNGDMHGAISLLEEALGDAGVQQVPDVWFRLAAMRRATGRFGQALDAIERALSLTPFDFFGLLSRASLLEKMGDDKAAEAYGRALAQRPENIPAALNSTLLHAEQVYAAYVYDRQHRLNALTTNQAAAAGEGERNRITRFISNVTRKTRHWHSEPTHFHYPGLAERDFHDREAFPWLAELEAETDIIADEFATALNADFSEKVPYIQYPDHEPLQQWKELNQSERWTAIHLFQNGRPIEANIRHCPKTVELLKRLPQPDIAGCSPNAMFSLLAPNTAIPAHVGVTNTRLVCHLPLIVPPGCWFRVGADTRFWARGEAFVFDDTIEHEAMNPSDALRVVLIFDVWHPGLSDLERNAVAAVMEDDVQTASLAL